MVGALAALGERRHTGLEEVPVTVHVEDPRRWISLILAVVLVAAVVLVLYALAGSTEPVSVGRS